MPLKSICVINKGKQLSKVNMKSDGKYYVLNGGITPSGFTDNYNTEGNTISISEGGNSCGFVNYNTSRFWSGGHCYTLDIINGNFNKEFLYQYLKYNESEIMKLRVGSGLPNIQKSAIEEYLVLKIDISFQEKIADLFGTIDNKIYKSEKLFDGITLLKKSLLQKLFI